MAYRKLCRIIRGLFCIIVDLLWALLGLHWEGRDEAQESLAGRHVTASPLILWEQSVD